MIPEEVAASIDRMQTAAQEAAKQSQEAADALAAATAAQTQADALNARANQQAAEAVTANAAKMQVVTDEIEKIKAYFTK